MAASSLLLEERGHVIALRENTVLVRAASRASCARCEAGEGCGGGLIGRLVGDRMDVVSARIAGDRRPETGDQVVLSVSPRVLVEAAATAYLVPLLVLLGALALAANWLGAMAPWWQAAYAGAALWLGLAASRGLVRYRRAAAWQPSATLVPTADRPRHPAPDRPSCG